MKQIISAIGICALLASCAKSTQTYTCQCYGGFTGGPTEKVEVKSTDRENAAKQCAALADPPTNTRNSCSLL